MNDMINFYIGYAISEITEDPHIVPKIETAIPEIPSIRVPANIELDKSGKLPVPESETNRELKEHHDIYGTPSKHYSLEVVVPDNCPIYTKDGNLINKTTRQPLFRDFDYSIKTPENKNVTGVVKESPSIKCYYWGGSNHSVPHITMGEQVLVIHHKGNDTYYWKELGRDNELRRVEKYRIFANDQQAVRKNADVQGSNFGRVNDDNSYYLEFDTINKHILISTSDSDGETVRYFMKFNSKSNTFSIWDTRGNRFEIDSKLNRLYMRNADQSTVDITGTHINMWSQDSINIESDHVNIIGRMDRSDITGMDPSYKQKQLNARLHQQSFPAPINVGTPLGPGSSSDQTKVMVGIPGYHSQVVSLNENVVIPTKTDTIDVWMIGNKSSLTYVGNLVVSTATSVAETYQLHTHTVEKNFTINAPKAPVTITAMTVTVTCPLITHLGVFQQMPLSKFKFVTGGF